MRARARVLADQERLVGEPLQPAISAEGLLTIPGAGDSIMTGASAPTHSEGTGMRLILARMISAGLVQMKGVEDLLWSRM